MMKPTIFLLLLGITICYSVNSAHAASAAAWQQQPSYTVQGTVSDHQGEPLIGVSIAVKGTAAGVITDMHGKFSVSVH